MSAFLERTVHAGLLGPLDPDGARVDIVSEISCIASTRLVSSAGGMGLMGYEKAAPSAFEGRTIAGWGDREHFVEGAKAELKLQGRQWGGVSRGLHIPTAWQAGTRGSLIGSTCMRSTRRR